MEAPQMMGDVSRGTCKNCYACSSHKHQKKDVKNKKGNVGRKWKQRVGKKQSRKKQGRDVLQVLVNERRASKRCSNVSIKSKHKQECLQKPWKKVCLQTQPQGMMHGEGPPFLSSWPAFSPQYQQTVSGLKPATSSPSVAALPNKLYPSGLESAALPGWNNAHFGRPLGASDTPAFSPNLHRTNGYLPSIPDTSLFKHADVDTRQLPHLPQANLQHHNTYKFGQDSSRQSVVSDKHSVGSGEKINGYTSFNSSNEMFRTGYQKSPGAANPFLYPGFGIVNEQQKQRIVGGAVEPPPSYEDYVRNLSQAGRDIEQGSKLGETSAGEHHPNKPQYGGQLSTHHGNTPFSLSQSTSVTPALPVTSSADKHMISYYSQNQTHGQLDNTTQSDKARRVAEEIMGEAHFSMAHKQHMDHSHATHSAPFPNISNMFGIDQQRQHHPSFDKADSSMYHPPDAQGNPSRPNSRPQSNHSVSSMDMNPTSMRPDHLGGVRNQNVFNTAPSGAKDFWSQFGLPPPNVVVSSQSSQPTADITRPMPAHQHNSHPQTIYSKPDAAVKPPKRKREQSKKKNIPVESASPEEVNAKVAQILAAIKESSQKQQPAPEKPPTTNLSAEQAPQQSAHTLDPVQSRVADTVGMDSNARQMQPNIQQQYNRAMNGVPHPGDHLPSLKTDAAYSKQNGLVNFYNGTSHGINSAVNTSVYDNKTLHDNKPLYNKPLSGDGQSQPCLDMKQPTEPRLHTPTEPRLHTPTEPRLHTPTEPRLHTNSPLTLTQQVNAVRTHKTETQHEPTYHLQNSYTLAQQMKEDKQNMSNLQQNKEPTYHLQNTFNLAQQMKEDKQLIMSDLHQNKQSAYHPNPLSLAQQVGEVRSQKKDGRISPCCTNCDKLGIRFSPHCQNHTKQNPNFDPYAFNDDMDFKAPSKYTSVVQKEQVMKNPYKFMKDIGHNRVINDQDKVVQQNQINMLAMENHNSYKNMYDHRRSDLSQHINKPQGYNSGKKLGSKMYNVYKSPSLMYYKKTLKNQQNKLTGVKKPNGKISVNGKKTKKKTADDEFARNLVKNLGFPPLTREDLVSKRQEKVSSESVKQKQSVSESAIGVCDKNIPINQPKQVKKEVQGHTVNSGGVNNVHSVAVKHEYSAYGGRPPNQIIKPLIRSKSFDNLNQINGVLNRPLKRSRSFSGEYELHPHEDYKFGVGGEMDMQCVVDNKVIGSGGLPNSHMNSMTDHIQGLQKMVTGTKDHLQTNTVVEVPKCGCLGPDYVFNEAVEGPYYTHLGAGRSVEAVRIMLEKRLGVTGKAIRIEKVRFTGKEGKSKQGCPIAKWIIRRSSLDEKYLAVLRHRVNHHCETAWLIIGLVAWEGVPQQQADDLYDFLSTNLPENGFETERRCGTNEQKMCACQGVDLMKRGASFSFGCSWSMYYNSCKFARSHHARKFKLKNVNVEAPLESKLQDLATHVGPLYKQCAPEAHNNQSHFSEKAKDCRLGRQTGGPFSGVTACVDFCAHSHRDTHNMNNGSTVVVTLTKHRGLSKPDDEQLHVLPMYVMEPTDEAGSFDGQYDKIQNGALEVLHHYPLEARIRSHPLMSCKKRRQLQAKSPGGRKKRGGHTAASSGRQSPWGSSSSTQSTPKKGKWDSPVLHSQDSNQSFSSQSGSLGGTPVKQNQVNNTMMMNGTQEKPITYEELMALSTEAGFEGLYERFWNYFYMYGAFPPTSFVKGHFRSRPSWNNTSAAHGQTNNNQWNQTYDQPVGGNSIHHKSEVASNYSVGKNCASNAVPLEQSQSAAKHSAQTTDLPQAKKDTVHLADPFSDGTSTSQRIPHQSIVDRVGPQPSYNNSSSNNQSGTGFPSAPQSIQSAAGKPDTGMLPQNCAMDLSSHSSYNSSMSNTVQQQQAHNHIPTSSSSSQQQVISQENCHALSEPYLQDKSSSQIESASVQMSAGDTTNSSPLALLSQTVEMMRSKDVGYKHPLSALENHPLIRQQMNADRAIEPQQQQHSSSPANHNHHQQRLEQSQSQSNESFQRDVQNGDRYMETPVPSTADNVCSRRDTSSHEMSSSVSQQHTEDKFKTPVTQAEYNHANNIHSNSMNSVNSMDYQKNHYGSARPLHEPQYHNSTQEYHHQKDESSFTENNKEIHYTHNSTHNPLNDPQNCAPNHHDSHKPVHNETHPQFNMNHGQTQHPLDYYRKMESMEHSQSQEMFEKSSLDPDVVKCQMEYNEEAFRDPNIGGVAVALGHGAVLFEVAKRELHATTGLKNPNRYHPTRISLVFYQHKNLNYERHGMYNYLKKMEDLKQERIAKMQAECGYVNMIEIENSFKGGKKRKLDSENVKIEKVEKEPVIDIRKTSAAYYRYMWDCDTKRQDSFTTNTLSQKWISPQPMVTGPYQKWV